MYTFRIEIKKIVGQKLILRFILLLLIGYICYFLADVNGKLAADDYSYTAYINLMRSLDRNNLKKEIVRLKNEEEELSNRKLYTENYSSEYHLYHDVLQELEHISQYKKYTEQVIQNMQRGDISLFQQSAYIRKEQEKTEEDFLKLQDKNVKFAAYKGVELLVNMDLSDVLLTIYIVLLVAMLVTMEKENATLPLLFTLPKGRKETGCIKYFTGLFLVMVGVAAVFGIKLLFIQLTYGLEGVENVVQSVRPYGFCRYDLTVGQFIIFVLLGKFAACVMLYGIIFCAAANLHKSLSLFMAVGIIGGVEAVCYYFISENSWLHFLKQINFVSFLSGNQVIGSYRNVNMFGVPQDYFVIVAVTEIVLCTISAVWGIMRFEKYIPDRQRSIDAKIFQIPVILHRGNRKGYLLSDRYFLCLKEMKKTWIGEKGFLFLIVFCFVCFILYSPLEESYADKDQVYYEKYMLEIQGKFSQEKINGLYQEKKELENIELLLNSDKNFTQEQIQMYMGKTERLPGLKMAIQNAEYMKRHHIPYFTYEKGYLVMLGKYEGRDSLLIYRLLAILFMVGMSVTVWGVEEWGNMEAVLYPTVLGRKTLFYWKRIHILILSFLIMGITFIPWVGNVISAYSCRQWSAPAGSIRLFGNMFLDNMPLGAVLAVFLLLHFIYLLLIGNGVRPLQKKLSSYILTVFTAFVLFSLPVFCLYGLIY